MADDSVITEFLGELRAEPITTFFILRHRPGIEFFATGDAETYCALAVEYGTQRKKPGYLALSFRRGAADKKPIYLHFIDDDEKVAMQGQKLRDLLVVAVRKLHASNVTMMVDLDRNSDEVVAILGRE